MCFLSLSPSFLVYRSLSLSLANYTLSCFASPLFFYAHTHFPSFFLKASVSPDRLAGDKTCKLGEERDILEQDGKRDGGHIPAWSPSPGSVETLAARRWVPFTACVWHPVEIRCHIKFL